MDERDVARLGGIKVSGEMAGCQTLHHHRCSGLVVDAIGYRHQRAGRNGDLLRIAAGPIDPGHTLANRETLDTRA
ncbi:hypothetical protein D3C72_1838220 [compost metagenome]